MEIRFALASAITSGGPTQDIVVTDGAAASLTPKAAIYELTTATISNTSVDHYRYGVGITDGTTQRAHGFIVEDGALVGVADCDYRHDTATVIQFPITTGVAIDGEASWDSWQTGGSRVTWPDLLATACKIRATYFYGDDIEVAVATIVGSSTQNGTASVAGLSFRPNFAFLISHYLAFAADGQVNDAAMAMGYAVETTPGGAIQQVAFTDWNDDRMNPTAGATVLRDDCCIAKVEEASDGARLELTSWNADGATFTTRDVAESLTAAVLFIRFSGGRRLQATIETIPADTSQGGEHQHAQDTFEVDMPFAGEACLVITTPLSAKNSTERSSLRSKWAHGVFDSDLLNSCLVLQAEDNLTTSSDTRSRCQSTQCGFLMGDNGNQSGEPFLGISFGTDHATFTRTSDSENANWLGAFVFIGAPGVHDGWIDARSGNRWRRCLGRR